MSAFARVSDHERRLGHILTSTVFPPSPPFVPFTVTGARVDLVSDVQRLRDAFSLRYDAYTTCGFIDPSEYPLRMEFDVYDDVSVHFEARDDATEALVGYVRLILDTRERLQVDEVLDISDYRRRHRGRLCEMSRLIVASPHRSGVSRAVRYAAFRWAETQGIQAIVGISRKCDRADFDRRRFLPMNPYRQSVYRGHHFAPLRSAVLYGNVFDIPAERPHIASLLSDRGPRPEQP